MTSFMIFRLLRRLGPTDGRVVSSGLFVFLPPLLYRDDSESSPLVSATIVTFNPS
jgi:hypothetical protein